MSRPQTQISEPTIEVYEVTAPDGRVIEIEGPPSASEQEVIAQAQQLIGEAPKEPLINFVNRGIAQTVLMGGGADTIIAGMNALNMPAATREPETFGEHVATGAGQGVGALPLIGFGLARLALYGSAKVAGFANYLLNPYIRAPVTAVLTETLAGAGVGGARSAELENPVAQAALEVGAGMASGMAPSAAIGGGRVASQQVRRAGQRAIQKVQETLFPFTQAGAQGRARAQLQQRSAAPGEAARLAGAPTEGRLSPAQATGEDNLIALERTLQSRDPAAWAAYQKRIRESEARIRAAVVEVADPQTMERNVDSAVETATRRTGQLAPDRPAMEASKSYADELTQSLTAAKARERELWDIPNIRVTTTNVRGRFAELSRSLPKAQQDDMPIEAVRLLRKQPKTTEDALILGEFGETLVTKETAGSGLGFRDSEPVRELHGFYSKMREIARNSRSGDTPNRNRARIADELADGAWIDLTGAADNPTEVGQALNVAREYSRQLNRTFRQGSVGRLLGYERTGAPRAMPEEALEIALGGRGGAQAAITRDELGQAATFGSRSGVAAEEAVNDFLKQRFIDAANPKGTFSLSGAQGFLRRNRGILSRTPELQTQMETALRSMQSADVLQRLRPNIRRVFSSTTPRTAIRSLMTGLNATEKSALRAGLVEHGLYTGKLDDAGNPLMSGERLKGILSNPTQAGIYTEAFDKAQVARLRGLADELAKLQRAVGKTQPTIAGEDILEPAPAPRAQQAVTYIVGTLGARVGAWFGGRTSGASLRTASKMASMSESGLLNFMNRHSTRLLEDAAQDPILYRSLMTPVDSADTQAGQTIAQWVKQVANDAGEQLSDSMITALIGTAAAEQPRRLLTSRGNQ